MAMLGMRAPSMLPSIKCSNCGDDIDMMAMADHVCQPGRSQPRGGHARSGSRSQAAQNARQLFPPARQSSRGERVDSGQFFRGGEFNDASKNQAQPPRASPPSRIDPAAANRPYARKDVYASNSPPPSRNPYDLPRDRNDFNAGRNDYGGRNDYNSGRNDYGYDRPARQQGKPSEDMKRNNDNPYPTLKPPSPRPETPKSALSSAGFFSSSTNFANAPKGPSQPRPASPRAQKDEAKREEFFSRAPSMAGSSRSAPRKPNNGNPYAQESRNPYASDNNNPYAGTNDYGSNKNNNNGNPYGLARSPSAPTYNNDRPFAPPKASNTTNDFYGGQDMPYRPRGDSRSGDRRPSDVAPLPQTTYGRYDAAGNGSDSSSNGSSRNGSSSGSGRSTPPSELSPGSSYNRKDGYGRDNNVGGDQANNPFNPYGRGNAPPSSQPRDRPNVKPYPPRPYDDDRNQDRNRREPSGPGLTRSGTDASMSSNQSTRARHVCRGCATPIVGKSIKAADGQLTGRYHRQCFNCTTCQAPFSSSQFYVFRDAPYCEYHYHALNGSLCTSCDRGIEGQYLETEKREMFHPRCLQCRTCRTVLGEEYFEVRGGVYCERHATAEVRRLEQNYNNGGPGGPGTNGMLGPGQGGPGGGMGAGGAGGYTWKAERRRTRMGIM